MKIPFSETSPNLIAIAGPNGVGKSTFYASHLSDMGLRFVNAHVTARELGLDAYAAAELAGVARRELYARNESFIFETVFSDPVGGKLGFLEEAVAGGYPVVLCFVGVSEAGVSEERVAMRVSKGGYDVPTDKLVTRYPRVMENLRQAMLRLPLVLVYDNNDLREPHRFCLGIKMGQMLEVVDPVPAWVRVVMPGE